LVARANLQWGTMKPIRSSAISYVIFRLDIGGEDSLLLLQHPKWGDWSLVGGHIEPGEGPLDAARREAEEELPPLKSGEDFAISPLPFAHVTWGPVESRSAAQKPTTYSAWFFSAEFLRPPTDALHDVELRTIAAIPLTKLRLDSWPPELTEVLAQLVRSFGDLKQVPMAWPAPLPANALPAFAGSHLEAKARASA